MTITYDTIADPTGLQAIPFTLADTIVLGKGEYANIGTDQPMTRQLNCRYVDGVTYVHPVGEQNTVLPWKFTGYVSPEDCRAWFVAQAGDPEDEYNEHQAEDGTYPNG